MLSAEYFLAGRVSCAVEFILVDFFHMHGEFTLGRKALSTAFPFASMRAFIFLVAGQNVGLKMVLANERFLALVARPWSLIVMAPYVLFEASRTIEASVATFVCAHKVPCSIGFHNGPPLAILLEISEFVNFIVMRRSVDIVAMLNMEVVVVQVMVVRIVHVRILNGEFTSKMIVFMRR